jgi:hypothetical protein
MTSHRKITPIITAFAVLSLAIAPAARATPLLSGYGGPGQGNQAILGSTLLGGPGGSGGGGSSSGGPATGEGGPAASQSPDLGAPTAPSSTRSEGANDGSTGANGGSTGANGGSAGRHHGALPRLRMPHASASTAVFTGYTLSEQAAASQPWLGISTKDLLYMILVFAVLALTGLFTLRMARPGQRSGSGDSRGAS